MTLLGVAAWGVTPGVWKQNSEKDFAKAQRTNTVVDSHGDVTLARAIAILLPAEETPPVVSAIALLEDVLYVASGADGTIYRVENGKSQVYVALPSTIVTCLFVRGGKLLAGGGGKEPGLYEIGPDKKVKCLFSDPSITYIWAIAPGENESLYLATGLEARLWNVAPTGEAESIFQADASLAKHLLSLAVKADGNLLVGTDEKGLIFEIDPNTKTSRVVYDAAESEISALLPDGAGGFYAATGDASKASARTQPHNGTKNGRADTPAESNAPNPPQPEPAIPPGEPTPTPEEPPAEPSPFGNPVLAEAADANLPKEQDIQAQAARSPDGSVTITLPAGRELPVLLQKGKRVVMIQDVTTGQVQAIPAENVRVTHAAQKPGEPPVPSSGPSVARPARSTPPAGNGKGNAVYHVDAAGMVHAIFRRPCTIEAMVRRNGRLLLATGDEGKIFFVTPDGMLCGEVVDTDARQVTALIPGPDDALLFATSNAGSVGRIDAKPAKEGTLICQPMDAKQIAQWGTLKLTGRVPDGSRMTVATRSGNLTPATEETWSTWTKETPLQEGFVPIGAPAARFLQYRITLTSHETAEPVLESIETIYQVANLAPVISSVTVKADNKGAKPTDRAATKVYRHVTIQANDPNRDKLFFRVQYQKEGSKVWIEATKDWKKPKYVWDTRTVEDGEYRLRVIASDEPSNTVADALTGSRISEPVLVDNTPPRFDKFTVVVAGDTAVLHGSATDGVSRLASLQYSVDSATKWQTFLPSDGICDSSHETFRTEATDLSSGAHQITVRAVDVYDNVGYAGQTITVGK